MCLDLLEHLRPPPWWRPWVWTDYRMMAYITRAVPDMLWRLYQIAAFTLAHASTHLAQYTEAMMKTEQAEETALSEETEQAEETALSEETEQAEETALSEETEQAEETALSVDQHFLGYSG